MTVEAGPNIVNSGLILSLDASNSKSYPGSGSTWTDLSGNARNSTLINSPTYSSSNNGSIVFNGTNNYASVASLPSLSTTYSLSFWFRLISITSAETQIFQSSTDIASVSITNSRIGSWNGSLYRQSSTTLATSTWYNFVMTCNGTNTLFYLNNSLDLTSATTGVFDSGTGYFAAISNGTRPLNANISQIHFYNIALTSTQVNQNFNAMRGRYGI